MKQQMISGRKGTELVLKGIPASPGRVTGVVKKIEHGSRVRGFPEGSILVSTMTDPSMLLYILRCGGIVTDIGGITSHAAIVSRELGVPCVVGTRRATKVLRDGMNVEVNGTEGTVKVLNGRRTR